MRALPGAICNTGRRLSHLSARGDISHIRHEPRHQGLDVRRSEITALGDLAGEALSAGSGFIGEMHHGIASRPFGILGPAAAPVRWIHNGVTGKVYAGLRGASRSAARSAA